jgi:hypothetical protein
MRVRIRPRALSYSLYSLGTYFPQQQLGSSITQREAVDILVIYVIRHGRKKQNQLARQMSNGQPAPPDKHFPARQSLEVRGRKWVSPCTTVQQQPSLLGMARGFSCLQPCAASRRKITKRGARKVLRPGLIRPRRTHRSWFLGKNFRDKRGRLSLRGGFI